MLEHLGLHIIVLAIKRQKAPGNRLGTSIHPGPNNNPGEIRIAHSLHTKYPNTHSTGQVRSLLGNEDILAGPRNLKCLFEG